MLQRPRPSCRRGLDGDRSHQRQDHCCAGDRDRSSARRVLRPRPARNVPTPPRHGRARDRRGRRGRVVFVVSVCAGVKQQPATVRTRALTRRERWKRAWNNPSRSEWTPLSPATSRRSRAAWHARTTRGILARFGRSFRIDACAGRRRWNDRCRARSKGEASSARGPANVIGTQHGQPDAQQPPLQAGAALRSSSGAPGSEPRQLRGSCPVAKPARMIGCAMVRNG